MTDFIGKDFSWKKDVRKTIDIIEARTKDIKKITNFFNSRGSKLISGDEDYVFSIIKKLKSLGWIKETKDAYILTEKGKKEVEKYKNLPWYLH